MWTKPIVRSKYSAQSGKRVWRAALLKVLAEREAGVEVYNLSARCHDLAHNAPAWLFQQAPGASFAICYLLGASQDD
jgi:hypothetical protein